MAKNQLAVTATGQRMLAPAEGCPYRHRQAVCVYAPHLQVLGLMLQYTLEQLQGPPELRWVLQLWFFLRLVLQQHKA